MWAGHVARMGEREVHSLQGLVGKSGGKRQLGRPGVDGRIIVKNIYIFIFTLLGM